MSRTNTTTRTTFTLPFPNAATFDFAPSPAPVDAGSIRITIPPLSTWSMRLHWHPSERNHPDAIPSCRSVRCVSGDIVIHTDTGTRRGGARAGGPGVNETFKPGFRVSWGRTPGHKEELLTADLVASHALWRNICSATLDRDIFPHLSSTPFWLKGLFALLGMVPEWRQRLLSFMLWVQLQAIFYAHDFHLWSGFVPITWLWMLQPFGGRPPLWAMRLQDLSARVIARVTLGSAYWLGRLFCGMRGEYSEYTASEVAGGDKI